MLSCSMCNLSYYKRIVDSVGTCFGGGFKGGVEVLSKLNSFMFSCQFGNEERKHVGFRPVDRVYSLDSEFSLKKLECTSK